MSEEYNASIINMYAVLDKKSGKYDTPFFSHNDIMAERQFTMVVHDTESMFHKFKDDFELQRIGSFNLITGQFLSTHEVVREGLQIALPSLDKTAQDAISELLKTFGVNEK